MPSPFFGSFAQAQLDNGSPAWLSASVVGAFFHVNTADASQFPRRKTVLIQRPAPFVEQKYATIFVAVNVLSSSSLARLGPPICCRSPKKTPDSLSQLILLVIMVQKYFGLLLSSLSLASRGADWNTAAGCIDRRSDTCRTSGHTVQTPCSNIRLVVGKKWLPFQR